MGDHSSVGVNCWVGTSLFRCFALRFFAQNRSYLRPTVSNLLSLKRATVIESFLSLCKKSNMSDSLVTFSNESLVFESGLLKKILFFAIFYCLSLLFPRVNRSRRSWQKSNGSNSLFSMRKSLFRSQKNEQSAQRTDK